MNVISVPGLLAQAQRHAPARTWVLGWLGIAQSQDWATLLEVREFYPSTDQVGSCLVFDVLGNHYRLIVGVVWARRGEDGEIVAGGRLYIKHLLSHAEYDTNRWKRDCDCDG